MKTLLDEGDQILKTAIITGASAGLGKEFVMQLQKVFPEIRSYWLIARRTERLEELAAELSNVSIKPISLDLTDASHLEHLQTLLEAGKPDVQMLINCAGCGYLGAFDKSNLEEQNRMVALNIQSLMSVTHIVLPYMPDGSRIINISSIASFVPNPNMTVYSSTKFFVSAFSRGLHEELKSREISVTAACPGPMATEFLELGRIAGNSKTFETLPYCDPVKVVAGTLRASLRRKAVYTPRLLYKVYRVLASLVPHALLIKIAGT